VTTAVAIGTTKERPPGLPGVPQEPMAGRPARSRAPARHRRDEHIQGLGRSAPTQPPPVLDQQAVGWPNRRVSPAARGRRMATGHSDGHISSIVTVPLAAAARSATPNSSATPMPSRPSMNSQFAQVVPAQLWKVDSNGPTSTPLRKPLVGEPPLIQALADGVA